MEHEELLAIEALTRPFPHTETGGDLFGVWAHAGPGSAFVDYAIGPGRDVRRTSHSFFQDANYLARAGAVLVQQHGLAQV